ncbi:Cyclin-D1-2 [Tetrabaena socialis]|uniref:Cyclin-D1-2 n=1 Tax=Tetrabaena socialis TaxID=47790 RepID=A0A2J7ZX16_9CHLO|nr:Cyclin-D1-2 [Tetrabaena socialis]|eukprot:PNH04820.1 Cyclin-D1-2 [Tetrabaena socialis]
MALRSVPWSVVLPSTGLAGRPHVPLHEWLSLAADPSGTELYELSDLQRMELLVLEALERRTDAPTAHTFLRHLLQCLEHCDAEGGGAKRGGGGGSGEGGAQIDGGGAQVDGGDGVPAQPAALQRPHVNALAGALAELALPSAALQRFPPSTVATACVAFALQLAAAADAADAPTSPRGPAPWPDTVSPLEVRLRRLRQRAVGWDSDAPSPATPNTAPSQTSPSRLVSCGSGAGLSSFPSSPLARPATASPATPLGAAAVLPPRAVAGLLAEIAGVGEEELAPGLEGCVAALAAVYQEALAWFAGGDGDGRRGGRGSLALPAVVARHAPLLSCVAALTASAVAAGRRPSPSRISPGVLGKRGPELG